MTTYCQSSAKYRSSHWHGRVSKGDVRILTRTEKEASMPRHMHCLSLKKQPRYPWRQIIERTLTHITEYFNYGNDTSYITTASGCFLVEQPSFAFWRSSAARTWKPIPWLLIIDGRRRSILDFNLSKCNWRCNCKCLYCWCRTTISHRHPEIMNREGEARAAQNGFLDSTESNSSVASTADSSEVISLIIKQLLFLSNAGDKYSPFFFVHYFSPNDDNSLSSKEGTLMPRDMNSPFLMKNNPDTLEDKLGENQEQTPQATSTMAIVSRLTVESQSQSLSCLDKMMQSNPSDSGVKDTSDKTACSKARATTLCILAEFCSKNIKGYTMAPDVLPNYSHKSYFAKFQIPNLTAKITLVTQDNFILPSLTVSSEGCKHALENSSLFDREWFYLLVTDISILAKDDLHHDIRDRARFLKSLMIDEKNMIVRFGWSSQ